MDLTTYVERLRSELGVTGGEAVVRLTLLETLSAAADEITREIAPGAVEVRLRGGEPEFVVTPAPTDEPEPPAPLESDDSATARINLRLPEQLKAGAEQAATREGVSVNSWLVRVVAAALTNRDAGHRPTPRGGRIGESFTGWVR
jgi:hypothetical protein